MNADWRFFRGEMELAWDSGFDDSGWEIVHVPHSVRVEPAHCSGGVNYQGAAWYRRHFHVPQESSGKKLFLHFEGAKHTAEVWVNGQRLGIHYGGYLPFTFDITDCVHADGKTDNIVAVKLDNSDMADVPPGRPQSELDFCYFGGLYRHVWLLETDKLHITDAIHADKVAGGGLFVTYPSVSEEEAVVDVAVHASNEYGAAKVCTVRARLIDDSGVTISREDSTALAIPPHDDATFRLQLIVGSPRLWHPDLPYLYKLETEIWQDDALVDKTVTGIGIRRFRFDPQEGFFLNGQRLKINGANRHQEYVYIGDALPDSLHRRDAIKLKQAGFNFIRLGHYPQSEAFMRSCNELGLMCVVPVPGWQWFRDNGTFRSRSYQDVRDMVRKDRNHPCVIFWEPILNETNYDEDYARTTYAIVHEEYPGDQCYAACDMSRPAWESYDIVYGHLNLAIPAHKVQFKREFGDNYREQFGPQKTQNRCSRGDRDFYNGGEGAMLRSAMERLDYIDSYFGTAKMAGFALWTGIDHNRGYMDNIAATGVLDLYRLPKFSYYMYSSQRQPVLIDGGAAGTAAAPTSSSLATAVSSSGPLVFIANYWSADGPETRDIVVFSNCDEIELTLNGRSLGRKGPERTYSGVPHPPFLFKDIAFEPGELAARGWIEGELAAAHKVRTAGKPHRLRLDADHCGIDLIADGSDLIMVHVYVEDEHGTNVTDAYPSIAFRIEGPGRIVGDGDPRTGANPVTAEAGAGGVLVQATKEPGQITIYALSEGLEGAVIRLASQPDRKRHVSGLPQQPPKGTIHYEADVTHKPVTYNLREFNLAFGKRVTASSEQTEYPASAITDSSLLSSWRAAEGTNTPQWLIVDLEGDYDLTGCKIWWESDHTTYSYRIDVSADGSQWKALLEKEGTGQDIKPDALTAWSVRYIRINVTAVSNGLPAIYLLGIYGMKAGTAR
ncbi:discoidin domain-containing protein [Paenibacillus sp. J5C_2022]|nr:discoidin domain-containing protein [Paenibacillus sp. J5C2022]